ncbi:ubiquitin carboxyl-terminal hydrolase 35 [Plodia interpunctella]|uniref:ubiquitin carboxyl-terminal hydrolase 35 n=1 Tax=Plodia interpunctella TaxID=58824 RepID=UPI0023677A48|nr:ubiquitin carboxyl-terminal hydrolase 35 [Plodia interpunctella]XP_053623795.1 ubiquitin carboxyl-terminal hydrolase 35 [Plodia interpunctella]XP_053623796.1 ubiquitin carboxyl-terminal hydrolase 35 [Plodia interpunctella]XP_053623797.1 ubiquitin carboxyl-terminal hydrolase 35 [Plodia interpunctella]
MAVKKHELVHDNRTQLDLTALAQYLELMNEQHNYLPSPNEIIRCCQDIVKCLARSTSNEEELYGLLHTIEVFLLRIVTSYHSNYRHEIVTAILEKFHALISDPQSDASPLTSIVLVVLDSTDQEATLNVARWLVQRENGPAGAGLRASLSCLYRWLYEWHGTPTLGEWVMAYIKALEEYEHFDILIEVSVDNLTPLYLAMDEPIALRQSVADVIVHILASLRESTEALDKIAPHVGHVLVNLAADSGQFSRQLLQNVVDILTASVDHLQSALRAEARDLFKNKYADVILCLERHMASRTCRYTQLSPWKARNQCLTSMMDSPTPKNKIGLLNLGNTCYMNSVIQALLATRQFSSHVILRMNGAPYWSKMGILFAQMMHCSGTKLNPQEFFTVFKPPFFTSDHQHDSSEFLGYLFELLQSYEHQSDRNFDYSRPAVLTGRTRAIAAPSTSSDYNPGESASSRRSVSPRPGNSVAGSSSGAKRSLHNEAIAPPKKRLRYAQSWQDSVSSNPLRRDSYIDNMFAGVLLTRIECTECHSSSLSRDVFRDLQLAFPEKPDGCQHNVQNLLEFYCSKERLSGDNQYKCHDCGELRDAERSVVIETTPKYLILVLKYFKFDPKMHVQTKLMHSIYHNHTVTLPTVRSQAEHSTYSLYAAVIHTGTTIDSGHYYTLAKDFRDEWHLYNDDIVTVSEETHLNHLQNASTPYILFYRRTDIDEGKVLSLQEMPQKVQDLVLRENDSYVEQQVRVSHQ